MNEVFEFEIDYNLHWEFGCEIDQIRKDLDEIEKLGATHVMIDSDISYDMSYVTIIAVSEREETDEENKTRLKELQDRLDLQKKRDLETIEILKQKYNVI